MSNFSCLFRILNWKFLPIFFWSRWSHIGHAHPSKFCEVHLVSLSLSLAYRRVLAFRFANHLMFFSYFLSPHLNSFRSWPIHIQVWFSDNIPLVLSTRYVAPKHDLIVSKVQHFLDLKRLWILHNISLVFPSFDACCKRSVWELVCFPNFFLLKSNLPF